MKIEDLGDEAANPAPIHYTVVIIDIIESRTNVLLNKKRCGMNIKLVRDRQGKKERISNFRFDPRRRLDTMIKRVNPAKRP